MERTINFLKYKYVAFGLSWAFIIGLSLITHFRGGFNFGIDFVGGHKIIAKFEDKSVDEGVIRSFLKDFNPSVQQVGDPAKNEYIITTKLASADIKPTGVLADNVCLTKSDLLKKTIFDRYSRVTYKSIERTGEPGVYRIIAQFEDSAVNEASISDALNEFRVTVIKSGNTATNEYIITTFFDKKEQDTSGAVDCDIEHIKLKLGEKYSAVSIESEETVGPAIGEYLRKSAWKLTLMAVLLMSVYLAFRFEIKYSIGGMVCLFHDMAMSLAFVGFMGIDFDIQILAALLTLYGYSINDTIVIFDRIRETNQIKSKVTFEDVINKAITQTLTRTILTGVTTLFALLVIFLVGGETLHDFAFVMLFGILIGTYSSIYIASPVVLWWEKWRSR